MSDDERVQKLIEEILDSGRSVEDVCVATPELISLVREGWTRLQVVRDQISVLFPDLGSLDEHDPTTPEIGLPRVAGYEISEVLGRGGVGVVYKALHAGLNRTVALKMLLAGRFATRSERQRFAREAELVAKLQHPNIVQVHDVGELDGRPYFTMEFVEGGSLAEKLAGTPKPPREAAELVATLAEAMREAHRAGIVHRDLKPSNVLLTADGIPKISDFGLARHLEEGSSLTQSGTALGTPSYMAPEQAQGKTHEIGPLADIYALGAVLYELLTGRPPFRAATAAETILQVITEEPAAPSRLNAKIPRDLETICLKCLRKSSALRYDSAAALAEDLGRFLRGETIEARPENWVQRLSRRVRRRPVYSAMVSGATLIMLASLGTGIWLIGERNLAARSAKVELAAMEEAAEGHLREMSRWLERSAWPEAGAALERARGRLGNRGSAQIRHLVDRKAAELNLAVRVEALRMGRANSVAGEIEYARLVEEHRAILKEAELGEVGDNPAVVAARIRASGIRKTLISMLDDRSTDGIADGPYKTWFLEVARLSDNDPTGWRNQVRRLTESEKKSVLVDLGAAAPLDDESVPLSVDLAGRMREAGVDPVSFLKRVQRAHPNDFWLNIALGVMLREKGEHADAIRFLQTALAVRKGAGFLHNELGNELRLLSKSEESEFHLREALRIDPIAPMGHFNLALTLESQGRLEEAIEASRAAIKYLPKATRTPPAVAASIHQLLGDCLSGKDDLTEAVVAYETALELDPNNAPAKKGLEAILNARTSMGEKCLAWQATLAGNPPDHQAWYGYAELCLFLGKTDEYRGARRALLDRFGEVTDISVAERTSRACLLLPMSEDEMKRIASLVESADRFDHAAFPAFYACVEFVRGLMEYRQGQFEQAIRRMEGEASRLPGPAPRLVLAMALYRNGRVEEARKTLAEAIASHNWGLARVRDQDDWIRHVLRQEAETLILPNKSANLENVSSPGR